MTNAISFQGQKFTNSAESNGNQITYLRTVLTVWNSLIVVGLVLDEIMLNYCALTMLSTGQCTHTHSLMHGILRNPLKSYEKRDWNLYLMNEN